MFNLFRFTKRGAIKMNTYSINLVFTTDRPLTEEELDLLRYQVIVQIEEPVDGNGDGVDYTTQLLKGGN
jgi:hypothetical protein